MARRWGWVAVVLLTTVAGALGPVHLLRASPAGAAVVHRTGFMGTVDGYSGWYGSYGMGGIGTAWCVDHGIPAPDTDLDYQPRELSERAGPTQTAIAWVVGRYGSGSPDAVTAAALTLVLHDLMGAAYPSGPLSVDGLDASRVSGFDSHGADVLQRARQLRADAIAHSELHPPLTLRVEAPAVDAGAAGNVTVRVVDAAGAPVSGLAVHLDAMGARLQGSADAVTGSDGSLGFPFVAALGPNHFVATSTVPDLALQSFAPRSAVAQRVVRPATLPLQAESEFTGVVHHTLRLHKTGDDQHYLPVTDARFEVRPDGGGPVAGALVVDANGDAPPLSLPAGVYEVVEVTPPDGYAAAAPVGADLTSGDADVTVHDVARRGTAAVTKTDAATGMPLEGASLSVLYDADHDGRYETEVARFQSAAAAAHAVPGLLPGSYALRENAAPAGYQAAPQDVLFEVAPGATVNVIVADRALPPPPPPAPPPPAPSAPPAAPTIPPVSVLAAPPIVPTLPVTGVDVRRLLGAAMLLLGAGLGLISGAAWGSAAGPRRRSSRGPPVRHPASGERASRPHLALRGREVRPSARP